MDQITAPAASSPSPSPSSSSSSAAATVFSYPPPPTAGGSHTSLAGSPGHSPHPGAAQTTLMSQHQAQTPWSGITGLTTAHHHHHPDNQQSTAHADDHDMSDLDVEDGGAALTTTFSHESDVHPAFPGIWGNAGPSWSGSATAVDEPMESIESGIAAPPASNYWQSILEEMSSYPPPPPPPPPPITETVPPHGNGPTLPQTLPADLEDELGFVTHGLIPVPMSNPNHQTLGPDNFGLVAFLRTWARLGRTREGHPWPGIEGINALANEKDVHRVTYRNLKGDECDFQGIDWKKMGISRTQARDRRKTTYKNYVNKPSSDKWHPGLPDQFAVPRDNYFRFHSMDIRRDPLLLHFQLRNILACSSRTRAFFPIARAIGELDPTTGRVRKAMDFGKETDVQISTVAATDDILIAGSFLGDYRYRSLHSDDRTFTEGKLTDHHSGITNHVQIHPARRSSAPLASFTSNDYGFRMVDLTTNKLIFERKYDDFLNCSAISTDKRLRVIVGDTTDVLIADAETGDILQKLSGHRDFGFACDWAPDGVTVATGFQDKSVRIWDARRWTNNHDGSGAPLAVLRMDMSGARSLRFSPLGSGKRLLVAAEEADVINVFDALHFNTQQKLEMFGEIGGTAFTNDGQTLMALNTDPTRGGLIQFDRCDGGAEDAFETTEWLPARSKKHGIQVPRPYDWMYDTADVLERPDSLETMSERRRKATAYLDLDPF
ncbi:WD40-repeat-containing domain protein [Pestalotiopsis sp. NC0098]|nr:WD40-repeat-containing domain protein [Pestalotiopsis sp. NC0098]